MVQAPTDRNTAESEDESALLAALPEFNAKIRARARLGLFGAGAIVLVAGTTLLVAGMRHATAPENHTAAAQHRLTTAASTSKTASLTSDPGILRGTWKNMSTKTFVTFQPGKVVTAEHLPAPGKTKQARPVLPSTNVIPASYEKTQHTITVIEKDGPRIVYNIDVKNVARTGHTVLLRVFD